MKTRIVKTIVVTTGALGCSLALFCALRPAPQAHTPFTSLAGVSVLELPQAAARLVSDAPPAQRVAVVREVVQAVVALSKPGVLPFAVSAICRACPDVAAEVVSVAVRQQPSETLPVARAAFSAAPAALQPIIVAICREVPQAYAAVAVVAEDQLPGSGPQIVRALATALPVLEPSLTQARTSVRDTSMGALMLKTTELVEASARQAVAQTKRSPANGSQDANPSDASRALTSLGALAEVNKTARVELAALDRNAGTSGQLGANLLQPAPRVVPPITPYSHSVEFTIRDTSFVPVNSTRNYSAP
jgi:hypothetical protein